MDIFIKQSLDYYDTKQYNYNIDNNKINIENDYIYLYTSNNNLVYSGEYEILGYLDEINKIWYWSWLISSIKLEHTKLTQDLLLYALKLDQSDKEIHNFIKSLLINSKINLYESIEIDIIIAIVSFILKNKIKYISIKKIYTDINNKKYILLYYLVK